MKICEVCHKRIDEYGTSYVKVQVVQNSMSQGYPDEFVKKSVECCPLCTIEALKNVLIGDSPSVHVKFEEYLKK